MYFPFAMVLFLLKRYCAIIMEHDRDKAVVICPRFLSLMRRLRFAYDKEQAHKSQNAQQNVKGYHVLPPSCAILLR